MIPVANIYYLLCYAWDVLDEMDRSQVDPDSFEMLPDLLGAVLTTGVRNIVKGGLHRHYMERDEPLRKLRGSPLFSESVARMEPPRAVLTCRFEEFTEDMDHNRLLKAALRIISRHPEASADIRKKARQCLPAFHRVSDILAAPHDFSRIVLDRSTRHYRLPLHIAKMIIADFAPQESESGKEFRGFDTSSSTTMGTLFEKFLLRFYARNGREFGWRSSSPQVRWNATPRQGANPSLLPIMNTDITLDRPSRSTIIEAKFYGGGAFTGRHNQPKFRSEPLYQLYAYLDNRSASMTEADGELTGLLLYADVAGGNITEPWTIGRHQMTIASVDLSAPWNEIHDRLMQLGHES